MMEAEFSLIWKSLDAEQRLVLQLAHTRRGFPSKARFKGHRRDTAVTLSERSSPLLELLETEDPQFVRTHLGDQVLDSAPVAERIQWDDAWASRKVLVMHSKLDPCQICNIPTRPRMTKPDITFDKEEDRDEARRILAVACFVKCMTCGKTFVADRSDSMPPICGRCGEWAQKACRKRRAENRELRKRGREGEENLTALLEHRTALDAILALCGHDPDFAECYNDPDFGETVRQAVAEKITVHRKMKLKIDIESRQKPGHVHRAGAEGIVVERLGRGAWLVEVRVPDESLVGDAWYETLDVRKGEFETLGKA